MANMKKASTAIMLGNGTNATLTIDDILSKGVTIKQAALIFHVHNTELGNLVRKAKIQPSGTRNGADIYAIRDIASVCVPPVWTDEEWEEVFHKGHFPIALKKDFWAAKKARLSYLVEAGEYWHTADVIDAVSELNKTFAMGVKLIPDTIDRLTTLTPEQRTLVVELLDEVMKGVSKAVADKFGERAQKERVARYEDLTGERINDVNDRELDDL